jgi:hypothetical protein
MFDAGSGSMVSIFLDAVHVSRKVISRSNLSYSDDENGCVIWIDNIKRNPDIVPDGGNGLGNMGMMRRNMWRRRKNSLVKSNSPSIHP